MSASLKGDKREREREKEGGRRKEVGESERGEREREGELVDDQKPECESAILPLRRKGDSMRMRRKVYTSNSVILFVRACLNS